MERTEPGEAQEMSTDDLLRAIGAELQYQNQLLEQLVDAPDREAEAQAEDEGGQLYECTMCPEKVLEDDRAEHMEREHNPPPGMDVDEQFEPVE